MKKFLLPILLIGSLVTAQIKTGINTTNPTETLEVNGITLTKGLKSKINNYLGGYAELINPTKTDPSQASSWRIRNMAGDAFGNALNFIPYKIDGGGLGTKLTLLDTGNVGIGTVTPRERLEVNGNAMGKNLIAKNNGDLGGYLELANPTKTEAGSAASYKFYNMTGDTYGNSLQLWNYDSSGSVLSGNIFTILDNGNVGIGVQRPQVKLAVNGLIRSQNILINEGSNTDKVVVADASGTLKTVPRNTVATNITINQGLQRYGSGTSEDPYTIGLKDGAAGAMLVRNGSTSTWETRGAYLQIRDAIQTGALPDYSTTNIPCDGTTATSTEFFVGYSGVFKCVNTNANPAWAYEGMITDETGTSRYTRVLLDEGVELNWRNGILNTSLLSATPGQEIPSGILKVTLTNGFVIPISVHAVKID